MVVRSLDIGKLARQEETRFISSAQSNFLYVWYFINTYKTASLLSLYMREANSPWANIKYL